jgi:hypothetical protein
MFMDKQQFNLKCNIDHFARLSVRYIFILIMARNQWCDTGACSGGEKALRYTPFPLRNAIQLHEFDFNCSSMPFTCLVYKWKGVILYRDRILET